MNNFDDGHTDSKSIIISPEEFKVHQFVKIVYSQVAMHDWEASNFPIMRSQTGRFIYFRIAENIIKQTNFSLKSLKSLLGDSPFTPKGLRERLKAMECDGLIELHVDPKDGRVKYLIPTKAFHAHLYIHAEQLRRIIEKDYLLIEK